MKRKSNLIKTEHQPRLKRTNLEIAGFTNLHLRTIKKIADMAQIPLTRVFSDVVEIGIAAVLSSYKPMIEMEEERRKRSDRIKSLFKGEVHNEQPDGEDIRQGGSEGGAVVDSGERGDSATSTGSSVGVPVEVSIGHVGPFAIASIESGFGTEIVTDLGDSGSEDDETGGIPVGA